MSNQFTTLFNAGTHRNILLPDFGAGSVAVQANQHLIIHGNEGMILDPGGHKVYSRVLAATSQQLQPRALCRLAGRGRLFAGDGAHAGDQLHRARRRAPRARDVDGRAALAKRIQYKHAAFHV